MPGDRDAESAFLLTFAHDLKVPLRSIVMSTQRIQRRGAELSEDVRARLEEIIQASRRQEDLISSVVEFDQASFPGLSSDGPLPLRLVIQTACLKLEAYRQSRGGSVLVDYESLPRVSVPSGFSRVIEKLLHNGLKFVDAGTIPQVRVTASVPASGTVRISISDNGIGIAPEYRNTVWEPFKRLNTSSQYPGNGLGLSICRRLIESIGGSAEIHDSGTKGTLVAVNMPVADA